MDNIPKDIICPLTKKIFKTPVLLSDNYTYEKTVIKEWLKNNSTSPITGENIDKKIFIDNETVKKVKIFIKLNPSYEEYIYTSLNDLEKNIFKKYKYLVVNVDFIYYFTDHLSDTLESYYNSNKTCKIVAIKDTNTANNIIISGDNLHEETGNTLTIMRKYMDDYNYVESKIKDQKCLIFKHCNFLDLISIFDCASYIADNINYITLIDDILYIDYCFDIINTSKKNIEFKDEDSEDED